MGRSRWFALPGVVTLAATMAPSIGHADTHCMTRVMMDVAAEEAPEEVKSKSSADFGPVTVVKVNKRTGRMTYCAHNSYCYNSNAFQWTTPCRLKLDKEAGDSSFFHYLPR